MSAIDEFAPVDACVQERWHATDASWFNYKANALKCSKCPKTNADAANVFAHELAHWRLHIATPYGFFLEELSFVQKNAALMFCVEYLRATGNQKPIYFPVYDFAQQVRNGGFRHIFSEQELEAVQYICASRVKRWSQATFLENVFEGIDCASVADAADAGVISHLLSIEQFIDDELDYFKALHYPTGTPRYPKPSGVMQLDCRACVADKGFDQVLYLGGSHVHESYARAFEPWGAGGIEQFKQNPEHTILFTRVCAKLMQWLGKDAELPGNPLSTMLAIADLALFTPVGGLFRSLRRDVTSWMDVHPGWRVSRMIEALPKVGMIKDLEVELESFQNALCDELQWPRPRQFLELGARLGSDGPIAGQGRFAEACKVRLRHYAAFTMSVAEGMEAYQHVTQVLAVHMPTVLGPESIVDPMAYYGETKQQLCARLVDFFMPNWAWSIMKSSRLEYTELIPAEFVTNHLKYTNINTVEDFVALVDQDDSVLSRKNFRELGEARH
jgi:hypothetical protein